VANNAEKFILTDKHNPLDKWQKRQAFEHWKRMLFPLFSVIADLTSKFAFSNAGSPAGHFLGDVLSEMANNYRPSSQ
jgi:hypothetical protein